MVPSLKISVLTPCRNALPTIARAISSVKSQSYSNWEHIIVDGASTDGTVDYLKCQAGVDWSSKPDNGQTEAMHDAFMRSSGDIIVYLNADDYFLPGAFDAVIQEFRKGAEFVVGNVQVNSERGRLQYINRPRTDLFGMMHHWERDAFCYNPVGYFYRRRVQEMCPLNQSNNDTMDLEFLLAARYLFEFTKIEFTLGCYSDDIGTKTQKIQLSKNYWTSQSFPYLEKSILNLTSEQRQNFLQEREAGYRRLARYWRHKERVRQFHSWFKSLARF